MVFSCRCFSLNFEEEIENETRIQTKSTSVETFYTAHSDLNGSVLSSHSVPYTIPETTKRWDLPSVAETPSNLRVFTLSELKSSTRNFNIDSKIGEGGFGSVYRGFIRSLEDPLLEIMVAVKKQDDTGFQGYKEWVTEVNVLGKIEHPNLVKLIGYCVENGENRFDRLLVYEYMPNGSLQDHLSGLLNPPPSWALRLRAALDSARGLAYLHEGTENTIIVRDFKPSNILLDDQWNAKLSDFGYARSGPSDGRSHVTTRVVGSYGYAAPEYTCTGHLTTKCDVYSYGVFLYVLITGKPAVDPDRLTNKRMLLEWVKPYLTNDDKFSLIVDPRIQGSFPLQSAKELSTIANNCLCRDPKSRPSMSDVLDMLRPLVVEFLRFPSSGADS